MSLPGLALTRSPKHLLDHDIAKTVCHETYWSFECGSARRLKRDEEVPRDVIDGGSIDWRTKPVSYVRVVPAGQNSSIGSSRR
jgi:hypothetical protein